MCERTARLSVEPSVYVARTQQYLIKKYKCSLKWQRYIVCTGEESSVSWQTRLGEDAEHGPSRQSRHGEDAGSQRDEVEGLHVLCTVRARIIGGENSRRSTGSKGRV